MQKPEIFKNSVACASAARTERISAPLKSVVAVGAPSHKSGLNKIVLGPDFPRLVKINWRDSVAHARHAARPVSVCRIMVDT